MLSVLLGFAAVAYGVYVLFYKQVTGGAQPPATGVRGIIQRLASSAVGAGALLIGLFLLASSSFVFIGADRVGHLKRIYGFSELPEGRIIALDGQKGPQAQILGPGFHFMPLVRVLYDIEEFGIISVPDGYYGELTAVDGQPMPEGMFIAPAISDDQLPGMLDAETFLTEGGYRGPQETVLKPGSYRLNQYLFKVKVDRDTAATLIPAGHVGVVKSNVLKPGTNCVKEDVAAVVDGSEVRGALTVPLVNRGCVGIWKSPLFPGAYYLNRRAYEVTLVDTRVQTWEYKGGFNKRSIDLSVDQEGNIKQTETSAQESIPSDAADRAVFAKMEGWDIPLELRALVQISPENAAVVVGSVGGIVEVENRILTPAIRSIVRNVAGGQISVPVVGADGVVDPKRRELRPTRVLDLIFNRDAIERTIEDQIKIEGLKAGVEIKEIRLGEPGLPPELLLAPRRVQLADELSKTYAREKEAQDKRVEREKARATADEQPRLVAAQIAVQVAKEREAERAALGRAERQFLEELAAGQAAQANVLGQDRVALLQALEKTLTTLERKPELVGLISRLVPQTVVGGDAGGFAGAAAILGSALGGARPAQPAAQ